MDVNEIIVKYVGSFGRYQRCACFFLGMIGYIVAFYAYGIVFTAAIPDHWCSPPDLSKTKFYNLTSEELKELTIPKEEKNGEIVFASCSMYDRNYSDPELPYFHSQNASEDDVDIKGCDHWTYDRSIYTSTATTEWDLVCEKKSLVAFSQSCMMFGKFVGTFFCGFFSDRFGRRPVILFTMILMIPVQLGLALAPNYYIFMIANVFNGALLLPMYLVSFVLVVELVGSNWREFVGTLNAILWGIGLITLSGVAYLIRDRMTLQLVISIPALSVFLYLPWLLSRGRKDEAVKVLKRMAQVNGREIPEEVLEKLKVNPVKRDDKENVKENFIHVLRCPLLVFRLAVSFIAWWGVNLAYVGLMLNTSNLSGSIYLNMGIGGLFEIIGYIAAQYLMGRKWLGRRFVTCGSFLLCGISLLITLAVPQGSIYITALAQFGKLVISIAFAVIYVYAAELFPSSIRNSAMSACSTFGKTANIIVPYIIHLGTVDRMTPLIIVGSIEICSGFVLLLLPETRGQKLVQTVSELKQEKQRICWWKDPLKEESIKAEDVEMKLMANSKKPTTVGLDEKLTNHTA